MTHPIDVASGSNGNGEESNTKKEARKSHGGKKKNDDDDDDDDNKKKDDDGDDDDDNNKKKGGGGGGSGSGSGSGSGTSHGSGHYGHHICSPVMLDDVTGFDHPGWYQVDLSFQFNTFINSAAIQLGKKPSMNGMKWCNNLFHKDAALAAGNVFDIPAEQPHDENDRL